MVSPASIRFPYLFRARRATAATLAAMETPLAEGERLLLGPGPSNVSAAVREAMAQPLLGHLDPAFLSILDETQRQLAALFGVSSGLTVPLSAPGSAGMEACLINLLEPGDRIVTGVAGVFGGRMSEVAARAGAEVTRVETEWGTPLAAEAMIAAIDFRDASQPVPAHRARRKWRGLALFDTQKSLDDPT